MKSIEQKDFEIPLSVALEEGREREKPWPLIRFEEAAAIEHTGGRFTGFVEQGSGRRFVDMIVDRRAHYDLWLRAIIKTSVSTEAINASGETDLTGPSEVAGYDLLVSIEDMAGKHLRSLTVRFAGENFSATQNQMELRHVASDAHRFILDHVDIIQGSELNTELAAYLDGIGWKDREDNES